MLRYLPILLLALATPASAETLQCVDPKAEVTLQIVQAYDEATGVHTLVSSKFKIMDELGYISEPDPSNDGDMSFVDVTTNFGVLAFDMHLLNTEKGYDSIVGSIRLTRASEGDQTAAGGTLHVTGGGAWAVACTETE